MPRRAAALALATLSTGVFVSGLDQTVVVSILPEIVLDLDLPITRLDEAAWLVTAYLLGYTALMPLVGRAADVHGYVAVFAAAAALFAGASWWAATTDGLWELVVARGLQAVGGGGMVPVALAVASATYAGRARVLALGIVTAAAEAGAVLGPLYGAAMLDWLGWRSVFWVNVPLAAALIALAAALVRVERGPVERVDYPGAALVGLALLALTLALSREAGGIPLWARAVLGVAAGLLTAAFVARQARVRWPLLPLELLRRRTFAAANGVNLLVGAALIVALVVVPIHATTVFGMGTAEGGFLLVRLTALIPAGALVGGLLGGRLPVRAVGAAGMATAAAGFVLLSRWGREPEEPLLTAALVVAGLGFGLVLAPVAVAALAAARGGDEAVGAASLTVARTLGMLVGLAALTAWGLGEFEARTAELPLPLREPGQSEAAYRAALAAYQERVEAAAVYVFRRLFLAAAGLCALGGLVSLALGAVERSVRPRS